MLTLEKPALGASTNLAPPLERMAALLRRRGMIVLASDLLAPLDTLEASLGLLTAGGHEVLVFQPIDPVELNLAFDGPSRFVDLETDRDLFLDPELARADYQRRFEAHNARVRAIVERLGITLQTLVTDRPLELALFDFLRMRRERGKITIQRRRAA
jgi:uncharacterized protein (DUF58 family)